MFADFIYDLSVCFWCESKTPCSSCLRDGMGAFRFTEECGYNILMVDQRAHRNSVGRTITFGVKERYDCLDWIAHLRETFGQDTKMLLIVLGADHGMSYMTDMKKYVEKFKGFLQTRLEV